MNTPAPKFKGLITSMVFLPDNPVAYKQRLLNLEGKYVNISPVIYRENRSSNQNAYYWGVVIKMIAEYCGYMPDDYESLSDELKRKFLGTKGKLEIAKSSSALNTAEFEEYMSNIRMWASLELGLYIPLPHEADF